MADYSRMSHKQLMEHFGQERQEWLAAGMSEVAIFRIHFGDQEEDGRGGDYRVWLNERKHIRADRKYAPGTPLAIDTVDPDGAWISNGRCELDDTEWSIDQEVALSKLTELQRKSFAAVRLDGYTQEEASVLLGVSRESVKQAIAGAIRKLQKFYS